MKQKQSTPFFFIAAAGIVVLAMLLFALQLRQEKAARIESTDFADVTPAVAAIPDGLGGPQAGDVAPPFTLEDVDGNEVSLADFAGQPIIVNFWATWCAPCRIEMPEFQETWEEYEDEGLVILALDQDESAETVTAYFDDEFGFTFTRPLLDHNHVVAVEYGAFRAIPTTVFINPDGTIERIYRGPLNNTFLARFVDELLTDA